VGTALSHHSGMGRLDFETETFVASTVLSHGEKGANPLDETLIPAAFNIYPSGGQGAQLEASPTEIANAVSAVQGEAQTDRGTRLVVPFDSTQITHPENRSNPNPGDPSHSMPRHGHPPAIAEAEPHGWRVRRLSVTECERLMGLPDDWTLVPYRGALAKDAPRYRALGNSFAVNCVRWIGRRIEAVEAILNGEK
jgi:DNA (cytosine-5)-methyltransferase 1